MRPGAAALAAIEGVLMKGNMLRAIGSPNYERLGSAPNSAEMRQIADGHAERQEDGRRILNLRQCLGCLAWGPLPAGLCGRCGRPREYLR